MSRKKRNPPPPSGGEPPPSTTTTTTTTTDELLEEQSNNDSTNSNSIKNEPLYSIEQLNSTTDSNSSVIKIECKRALAAFHLGNHIEALKIARDTCLLHQNSAFAHRVRATVCTKLALLTNVDNHTKQMLLNTAIDCIKGAISLSPNAIDFALFYANLLLELPDPDRFKQATEECRRALQITNPIDHSKDILRENGESRIENIKQQLEQIMEKSISSYLINQKIGGGNSSEITRSIDPMLVQTTRQKNENHKEIEFQVAASTLLRLKQISDDEDKVFDSSSGSNRLVQNMRCTNMKEAVSNMKRYDQIRPYWNSLSVGEKHGLLEVRISDLRVHFGSIKDFDKIVSEAIEFAEKNKTWKFFDCCICNEKFVDSESLLQHVELCHLDRVPIELQSVVPSEVDEEWVDKILNGPWKPVDALASLRIIKNQMKRHLENVPREARLLDEENGFSEFECNPDDQKWPLSDDPERAKILKRIHGMFKLLLMHQLLAMSHVEELTQYTVEELQKFVPELQLLVHELDDIPIGICFLGASQLEVVLKFLKDVSEACGLNGYLKNGRSNSDIFNGNREREMKEKIVLTNDFSCLRVDERLLRGELTPRTYDNDIADDGSAIISAVCEHKVSVLPTSDNFIYWLFMGSSIEEQLASWASSREANKDEGLQIFRNLGLEYTSLIYQCKKKFELRSHEKALQSIQSMWIDELTKREEDAEYIKKFHGTLLRKRRDELSEREDKAMSSSIKVEIDLISIIVNQARAMYADKFGPEALTAACLHVCDMKCGEEDECIRQKHLQEEEDYIEIAFQRQKEHSSAELFSIIDACIMRSLADIRKLKNDLGRVSAHDFRSVMLPLLRLYMRARLENLAEKYAEEKSAAATEALLAELELDDKKKTQKGGNQTKHTQDKPKRKKKHKDHRKQKDPKAIGGNRQQVLQEEDSEKVDSPAANGGENPNSEIAVSATAKELNLEKEELGNKTELGEEEGKLEDALEHERLIENETKEKQLEEQNKKASGTIKVTLENPNSKIAVPATAEEIDLQKEETGSKTGLGAGERKLEDALECERLTENETNEKQLEEQNSKVSGTIGVTLENPKSEIAISATAEELDLQVEEPVNKTEIGAKERKLEDALECETLIENETKEKQLKEQNKKASGTIEVKLENPNSEIAISATSQKLDLQEEELGNKTELGEKLSKIDACIMRSLAYVKKLEIDLGRVSAHDFRSVMLPLLRLYMRARLENLANKDSEEKSAAVTEELLPELELDEKKKIYKGSNQTMHTQDKRKNKKYSEHHRKQKDPKAIGGNKQQVLKEEHSKKMDSPSANGGENLNSEISVSATAEELDVLEDELGNKTELGAEERKPEVAKEKQLQEQNKKASGTIEVNSENMNSEIAISAKAKELDLQEDLGNKTELGAKERKLEDALENKRLVEKETKEKQLEEPNKKASRTIVVKLENPAPIMYCKPSYEGGPNVYEQLYWGLIPAVVTWPVPPDWTLRDEATAETISISDAGTGLRNEAVEYNCFLNVIIQSLWNVRQFRNELLRISPSVHVHVGVPCVVCALCEIFNDLDLAARNRRRVCALFEIFNGLNMELRDRQGEAIDPTSLRIALSSMCPNNINFIQEGEMNDAYKVLELIFDCLHLSFDTGSGASDTELEESNCLDSWECLSNDCISHNLFWISILEGKKCIKCGDETRGFKYSFFHYTNACALRILKIMHRRSPFHELLKLLEMNQQISCNPEAGGCGGLINIHQILSAPPFVFISVIDWESAWESAEDISALLTTLTPEIDLGVLFQGLDPGKRHRLIAVVCCCGRHYCCFTCNHENQKWSRFDDKNVKEVGFWNDVLAMCAKGHLQPQFLFFEAVCSHQECKRALKT